VADPGGGPDQWQYSSGSGIDPEFITGAPLLRAGLRSADATEAGINTATTQGGGQSYSTDGMDPGSAKPLKFQFDLATRTAFYTDGCRVSYYVPSVMLDYGTTVAADKYLHSMGSGWITKGTNGKLVVRAPMSVITAPGDVWIHNNLKASRVMVATLFGGGLIQYLYIDGLIYKNIPTVDTSAANFQFLYFGGLTSAANSYPAGHPMSDLIISADPFVYTASATYGKVVFFGDSLTTQGSPYATDTTVRPWNPGYGWDAFAGVSTTPNTTGSWKSDETLTQEVIRSITKRGHLTENNANEAQSGGRAANALARAQAWFAAPNTADIAVVGIGTNDIAGGTSEASFRASLQGIADECIAAGVKKTIFWSPLSLRNNPTYQTSTYDTRTEYVRSVVMEMASYDSTCYAVDTFTLMGGHSFDSGDFNPGDIHPNNLGSGKVGRYIGTALAAAL
jgi:lysophospholipase L1-like esterase